MSRTKPEIALDEIDRLIAAGVRFGTVLADAGYGLSAAFRQGLGARNPTWAVGISKHQKVYPHDVALSFLSSTTEGRASIRSPIPFQPQPKQSWKEPLGRRSVGVTALTARSNDERIYYLSIRRPRRH